MISKGTVVTIKSNGATRDDEETTKKPLPHFLGALYCVFLDHHYAPAASENKRNTTLIAASAAVATPLRHGEDERHPAAWAPRSGDAIRDHDTAATSLLLAFPSSGAGPANMKRTKVYH
eukprot:gene4388-3190_t